jgi:hypothetical protein
MKFFQSFIISLFAFFIPIQGILIAIAVTIIVDTLTGIYKAKKLNEPIISKKLRGLVSKAFIYETVIIMLFIMDVFILSEFFELWFSIKYFFTKAMAITLIFIELVSIKENIEAAQKINIYNQIRKFIKESKNLKKDLTDLTK